jgi:hypothetical protein
MSLPCVRDAVTTDTGGARLVTETREHQGETRDIREDAPRRKGLKNNNKEQEVTTLCRPVTPEVTRWGSLMRHPAR